MRFYTRWRLLASYIVSFLFFSTIPSHFRFAPIRCFDAIQEWLAGNLMEIVMDDNGDDDNDDDDEVDGGDGNGNQEGGYVAL